jgi:hypothetical protein
MPNNESRSESERLIARRARDNAQLILGQIHGVVYLAINDVDSWLEQRETTESDEPELTAVDIRKAGAEMHAHFGTLHAALNTGKYDEELVRVGFSGDQVEVKRKGFLPAVGRFFVSKAQALQNNVTRLRGSLKWSNTLIGSITAALRKEIDRVPGAAAAGEAIKEIIEVLLNATEPSPSVSEPPTRNKQGGSAPK